MSNESAITDELRRWLGVESEPRVFDVEKGHVKSFAQAVGDPNPIFQDEAYARKSKHGGIIAPPLFLQDNAINEFVDNLMATKCSLNRILNGGVEIEWYKPMKAGDVITTRAKLADLSEKEGKSGRLLFMLVEATFTNQRGELVARGRHNFIRR